MNNSILKLAIHRLASKLTCVNTLYYTKGDIKDTEQIVFYIINDSPDGRDTSTEYATATVQFNLFSKSLESETNDNMLAELQTVVTKENLVLTDGSQVLHVKKDYTFPSKWIENVYQSTIQYSIHIKKV